jgi:hypothetical protein
LFFNVNYCRTCSTCCERDERKVSFHIDPASDILKERRINRKQKAFCGLLWSRAGIPRAGRVSNRRFKNLTPAVRCCRGGFNAASAADTKSKSSADVDEIDANRRVMKI